MLTVNGLGLLSALNALRFALRRARCAHVDPDVLTQVERAVELVDERSWQPVTATSPAISPRTLVWMTDGALLRWGVRTGRTTWEAFEYTEHRGWHVVSADFTPDWWGPMDSPLSPTRHAQALAAIRGPRPTSAEALERHVLVLENATLRAALVVANDALVEASVHFGESATIAERDWNDAEAASTFREYQAAVDGVATAAWTLHTDADVLDPARRGTGGS